MPTTTPSTTHWRLGATWAAVADTVAVTAFVLLGRGTHAEPATLAGTVRTAWPFLVGLAVGWLVVRAWQAPVAPLRTGLPVVAFAVVTGMLLRATTGQGLAVPFLVVALLAVGAMLVGWRTAAVLLPRGSRTPDG